MSVTVTELSDFERRLTIRFDGAPLRDAENRAARLLSHQVHINGFRRGKAPRRMVEKMVGRDLIRHEAVREMVEGSLPDALDETGLVPAANPELEEIRNEEDAFEVDVRVALWPALESPPEYEGRRFELDGASEVDPAEVERYIEHYLEGFAELETVERPALDGDYAAIDIESRSGDRALAAFSAVDLLYGLGSDGLLDGLDDSLAGCSAGDVVDFASSLRHAGDGLEAGSPVDVRVAVKEVKEKRLPDLDDEWVGDFTEFDSVEEMKISLQTRLDDIRITGLQNQLREKVFSELIDEIDATIPAAVIGYEAERLFRGMRLQFELRGVDDFDRYLEEAGQDREALMLRVDNMAAERVRTNLLLDAVAAHAGLEVEDRELQAAYEAGAAETGRESGELKQRIAGSRLEAAMVSDILRQKAAAALIRAVAPVDRDGNALDLEFGEFGAGEFGAAEEAGPGGSEEAVQAVLEPEEAPAAAVSEDMVVQAVVEPEDRAR